jgi:glycosyltransferase involved in cell wall biosynthesis
MVDYIYKRSNRILTCSNSFIGAIRKRGIDEEKIEFWPQYAEDYYKPMEELTITEIPDDGILNLVFAGNIGYAQGLDILPKVARKLKNEKLAVRFTIIGDGRFLPVLKQLIEELKVNEYFNFVDRKPSEQIPEYLSAADALLITLSKSEVFSITIPAKTQSCLACGKPILVSADGEVQRIIQTAKCGLVSAAEDVDGMVDNIKALLNMGESERHKLGDNSLVYSRQHFNKEVLLNRMDTILKGE